MDTGVTDTRVREERVGAARKIVRCTSCSVTPRLNRLAATIVIIMLSARHVRAIKKGR